MNESGFIQSGYPGRPSPARRFSLTTPSPGPFSLEGHTSLAKDYEAAPAFGTTYQLDDLPEEVDLRADLQEMLRLYFLLTARGGLEVALDHPESGDPDLPTSVDEQRRYRRHRKLERNSKASALAKKAHGYVCEACGFDFEAQYGELGKGYIEAHHLTPLSSLPEGRAVSMDPKNDFTVLCANCHRMVHRSKPPITAQQLQVEMQNAKKPKVL